MTQTKMMNQLRVMRCSLTTTQEMEPEKAKTFKNEINRATSLSLKQNKNKEKRIHLPILHRGEKRNASLAYIKQAYLRELFTA